MKKLFKTTLVLALTVFASASFATGIDTYIKARGEKTFSVHHNTTGKFQITIKDEFGKVLYTDKNNDGNAFAKTFSVKLLPVGTYKLETEDAEKISTYPLEVLTNSIVIDKEHAETIYKPSVNQKEKMIDVSMLKLSNDPLNFSIYDSSNQLVHTMSLTGQVVNKRFDLSNLKSGYYSLYFVVGDKSFKQAIQL